MRSPRPSCHRSSTSPIAGDELVRHRALAPCHVLEETRITVRDHVLMELYNGLQVAQDTLHRFTLTSKEL